MRRFDIVVFFGCFIVLLAHGSSALDLEQLQNATEGIVRTWIKDTPATSMPWNWGDGVLMFGFLEAYRALGSRDPFPRDYVQQYMQYHMDRGIRVFWSDKTTPALADAELILRDNITEYRSLLNQVATYVMDEAPRSPSQGLIYHLGKVPIHFIPQVLPDCWIDSLFHWVPTLHRMTVITGDSKYSEEAVSQLLGFARNMQDPVTGLVTHSYNDYPLNQQIPAYEERAFWARGNGWFLSAIVDTIYYLPSSHPDLPELIQRAKTHEAALRAAMNSRGLFHTILLDSTTYEETAGSALITYALARGANLGIFGAETFDTAVRGMEGLLTVLIFEGDRVLVDGTSIGTGPRLRLYPYIPQQAQVTYGVGSWLMAARQFLNRGE